MGLIRPSKKIQGARLVVVKQLFLCSMNAPLTEQLQRLRLFYESGATRDLNFRRRQLEQLKAAIYTYEKEIHAALYQDLRKSEEESWVTETGFLVAEINHTLRHLQKWMRPEKVPHTFALHWKTW